MFRHLFPAAIAVVVLGTILTSTARAAEGRAARYEALFRTHCLPRIEARASGKDPLAKPPTTFVDRHSGLTVQQSRHTCDVSDDPKLLSAGEREEVAKRIRKLVAQDCPELSHASDPMPSWDYFYGRVKQDPSQGTGNWGIILMRVSADSGDALQRTTTILGLPRD
ncbi:MAG: hypothetical protein N4A53_08530 [Pelagimonas sp.]|jgi:hypothetical protein|nr:hypothetical protein [Pelagimonas sp.]